ncbi:MAG: PKD domain-containing protein, partial [Gemmatimonadetes bacterium]|nr:PKD domain-containing protein [Gemmatimonadota bacterium]
NYNQVNRVYLNALPLTLSSTSPVAAFASAPSTANLTATFSEAVTGGAAASFVVHSALSGQQAGAYSGNNSTTLTFNPTTDFFPGETVFSTLTTAIQTPGGIVRVKGQVWQFTTGVAASSPGEFHSGGAADVSADAHTTSATTMGDVDGDGDLDLIAGNGGVNRLYLGDGSGGFSAGDDITSDSHSTVATSVADVDGDGNLDLIAGTQNNGINRLYLGNGSGGFAAGSDLTADGYATHSLSVADLDGDGDLDVIAGNYNLQINRLYLGDGSGNFASGANITSDAHTTTSTSVGDVDGDGDVDLVVGNLLQVNRLYLGDGLGAFAAGTDLSSDTHGTYSTNLGDLDADGALDLIVGNGNPGTVNRRYLGNGSGGFDSGADVASDADFTQSTSIGDMDGDGDLDLIVGNQAVNRLYLGNGSGGFGAGTNIASDAVQTNSTTVGDVDGDGDLDLIVGNYGQVNRVYLNAAELTISSTSPTAAFASAPSTANVTATFSEAVTGGAAASFVVHSALSGQQAGAYSGNNSTTLTFNPTVDFFPGETVFSTLTTAVQTPSGISMAAGYVWQFSAAADSGPAVFSNVAHNFASGSDATQAMAIGDLDSDGYLDLAVGNWSGQNVAYSGIGDGSLAVSGNDFGTGSDDTYCLSLGDVDADGDLDLVLGNYEQQDVVCLNDGDGTFDTTINNVGGAMDLTDFVLFGDVDGDGDLDLAVGTWGQQNVVYLNDGDGTYDTSAYNYGTESDDSQAGVLGDVDGDGDLDLVVGNFEQQDVVYHGDGDGSFDTANNTLGTGSEQSRALALGDADGDGNLDLALGSSGGQNVVYLGNGTGGFSGSGNNFGSDKGLTKSLAFGDVDGDGDLDLALGNKLSQSVVILGIGDGTFAGTTRNFANSSDKTYAVVLGDMDGDGDLDLAVGAEDGQNAVYLNSDLFESTVAVGLSGETQVSQSQEALLYAIGVTSSSGETVTGLQLTLADLSSATGVNASDIESLKLYRSNDAILDANDTHIGTQTSVNIGSVTALTPSATETLPSSQIFYLATVVLSSSVIDGHALTVAFAAEGLQTSGGNLGTAVSASDSDKLTINVTATQLVFTTQPSDATYLQALTGQPIVEARDAAGNLDTGFTGTVSLSVNPSGVATNNTAIMSSGLATFSGLQVSGGTGLSLVASSGTIAGTSATFDVAKAEATVSLTNLAPTYDGTAQNAGATTVPADLAVVFSYADPSGNALSAAPTGPGSFNVTGTINDVNYQGSATATIVIAQPNGPVVQLAASATEINPGESVTFTNQSSGFVSGSFLETGDGSNSIDGFSTGSVTYANPGTYTVTLTVAGAGGTATAQVTVVVRSPPVVAAIPSIAAQEDAALVLDLAGNDTQAGTWAISGQDAAFISKTEQSGEVFTFTPVENISGATSIVVTRTGSTGLVVSQTVQLMWEPVDDPPQISGLGTLFSAVEDMPLAVGGTAHAVDIDTDPT